MHKARIKSTKKLKLSKMRNRMSRRVNSKRPLKMSIKSKMDNKRQLMGSSCDENIKDWYESILAANLNYFLIF